MKTYSYLQNLTDHEAGAIQYSDGTIWIGNWSSINGIPRQFATGMIGLGETLTAKRCAVPIEITRAIQNHERDNGDEVSTSRFVGWRVNDEVTVVIQKSWN